MYPKTPSEFSDGVFCALFQGIGGCIDSDIFPALLAIDTRARTTINESTRRGWPLDIPPVCTMDAACMRDVEDAVPYAKDAVLS